MGASCGERHVTKKIRVMTLNYCGISNSPFQFYISDYEPQLRSLGKKFEEYIKAEPAFINDKDEILVSKKLGKVEKEFKSNRYSPLFELKAGIKTKDSHNVNQTMKPMSEKEFKEEWQKLYEEQKQTLLKKCKKLSQEQFNEQIEYIKTYDFLAYKAFVKYVYNQTLEEVLKDNKDFNKYQRVLQPFFDFSFLDEYNKLSKFKYGYLKAIPDIFFVQDYSDALWQFLQNSAKRNFFWFAHQSREQIVILKRDTFAFEEDTFHPIDITTVCEDAVQYQKPSDAVKNKILAVESDHFLIVSLYLTSREKANIPQVQYLNHLLNNINQSPQYSDKTVIMGGDINSFFKDIPKGFNYYPQKEDQITTYKKRTALQVQIQKQDVIKKKSIDKIITNQKILEGVVTLIDGELPDKDDKVDDYKKADAKEIKENGDGLKSKIKMLLPCDNHPFDQFIVRTDLQIPDYDAMQKSSDIIKGLLA